MRHSTAFVLMVTVLLTGSCGTPVPSPKQSEFLYNHSMQAFEFSANCPKGCFLGIKPLITTSEQALRVLQHSADIDHASIQVHGYELDADWKPTDNNQIRSYVVIGLRDGLVNALTAEPIETRLQDFASLLGEPDWIKVKGFMPPDSGMAPDGAILPIHYEICYSLYYSRWRTLIDNPCGATINGPDSADPVDFVVLNTEINAGEYTSWKGYGRMDQYMSPEVLQDYEQFTGDYRRGTPSPAPSQTQPPRSSGCTTPLPCGAQTPTQRLYWPSYIDQLAFEQTVRDFVAAVERSDYVSAEQYATPEFAKYLDELANGTGAARDGFSGAILHGYPLKLVEVKPYYENGRCPPDFNVLQTKPTVNFLVRYEYMDANGEKTQAGIYVQGVKGTDGYYRIGGFASCTEQ